MKYISLFSGIEAASVAWEPLGWEPVAFSEVEPFCCDLLARKFPTVPNLGDIREIDWSPYRGAIDLVVGGSPCQSFSIAGGREGLDGESRLMYEYIRACDEIRPAWTVWENVPGVFTTDQGRAFGILLDALEKIGYGLAWRVLDAQFFGVAQRRERVFLVGHIAEGGAAAAVLFESQSVSGNTQSSRQKRASLTRASGAGSDAYCIQGGGQTSINANGLGVSTDGSAYTLTSVDRHGVVSFAQNERDEVRLQGDGTISGALSASPGMKQQTYTCISDDNANAVDDNIAGTLKIGGGGPFIAFSNDGYETDVAGTLSTCNADMATAYGSTLITSSGEDVIGALCRDDYRGVNTQYVNQGKVVAYTLKERAGKPGGGKGALVGEDCAFTMLAGSGQALVPDEWTVRRLTPLECERLQGFPDEWTAGGSDSARYKALGNSMAVPVMRWIGERIDQVEGILNDSRRDDSQGNEAVQG